MARDFVINGECLVTVKGGEHMSGRIVGQGSELGLAAEGITIFPRFVHRDIHIDDFGPDIPADVMWQLADVTIRMNLVHYDRDVLDICLREAMGGSQAGAQAAGILAPTGTLMGGMKALFASGNHFISLGLKSPVLDYPWRFPASYLFGTPVELPLGTAYTQARCTWRAIPYREPPSLNDQFAEWDSSGVKLWDHLSDPIVITV